MLEMTFQIPNRSRVARCVVTTDGNPNSNHCNYSSGDASGVLFLNARFIGEEGDQTELGIKTKYELRPISPISGDDGNEIKDIPEQEILLGSGEVKQISVPGLGTVGLQAKYLNHVPALLYSPEEALDPRPDEFRIVSPVLVRDKEVIANEVGSSSIDTGDAHATLMFYVPGEGRYLVSLVPFEGAVEGVVKLGQIEFTLARHKYLLMTAMPTTLSKKVWVKQEPEFKPSERMVRGIDARDEEPMFLVRSLKKLEQERIEH